MRTTLKRGIGRVTEAGANGNGHAVAAVDAITSLTQYRQPKRPGGIFLVGRILLWMIGIATVVGVAMAGGTYLWLHEQVDATQARSADVKRAQERLDVALPPDRPATALVIGYDQRAGLEQGLETRSDTVMLLRADPETKTIAMLSFPRDLQVPIVCPGKATFTDRINAAYSECGGAEGTLATVKALTGLDINYIITADFHAFKQVVAKVGGVWVDVDRRYFNDNSGGGERYAAIDIEPGYQRLNGADSLEYVRYRHADSDVYRLIRQQTFVKSLREAVSDSVDLRRLAGLVNAITSNVEVGQASGKALDSGRLLSFARFAYDLPAGNVFQVKIDVDDLRGQNVLEADDATIDAVVQEFLNPDTEASEKATAVALRRRYRSKTGPRPASVSVVVLNGNGVEGAAANASYGLAQRGYTTLTPPNGLPADTSPTYSRTTVFYDFRQRRARDAAAQVAKLFGEGAAVIARGIPAELRPLANGAMLVPVVGASFNGRVGSAPVDRTPERQAPTVKRDTSQTRPLLQRLKGSVSFPLMLPTVLEATSTPDDNTPIRRYTLGEHDAVRMIFLTGSSEWWGIQQTSWEDAPVLAGGVKRTLAGRTYELHYNGSKLHMVVLRANGATYWVVNTLLDKLSNETMLSIARGLKPLRGGA